jgi:DNA-binding FrmR family transcriptional regulator
VQLDDRAKAQARTRLRRVQGQINGILAMIEDDRDCTDVITQVAAASRALDRAGLTMVTVGLEQCMLAGEVASADRARLERILLSLG